MASFGLHMFTRAQLRDAQADAVKKLAFVRDTIKNIPDAYVPFTRLQEISFLEQRVREYRTELGRRRKPDTPVKVFYSYTRSDEEMLIELDEHLSEFKGEAQVEIFWDRDIEPGREWHTEIKDELRAADAVLLLVSPDFLASRYCRQIELPAALDLHDCELASAIPLVLRPCAWQETVLGRLQAIPSGGKPITEWAERDDAWAEAARAINSVINRIRHGDLPAAIE
ncbi:MAG: hypothetical protein QOH49_461 [Acidobacteriota bacterium]|jgi:hypothetical protein|nr:hypothetical protein [Acidobacteriota bacterium]